MTKIPISTTLSKQNETTSIKQNTHASHTKSYVHGLRQNKYFGELNLVHLRKREIHFVDFQYWRHISFVKNNTNWSILFHTFG